MVLRKWRRPDAAAAFYVNEVIIEEDFVRARLEQLYKKRQENLEMDLLKLDNKVRFVQELLEEKTIFWCDTEWGLELKKKGFTPFPKNTKVEQVIAEATDAVDEQGAGNYDYLIYLPWRTFTDDGLQKLTEERDQRKGEVHNLRKLKGEVDEYLRKEATLMSFWNKYLDAFWNGDLNALIKACIGEVEEDNSNTICLFVNVNGKNLPLGTLDSTSHLVFVGDSDSESFEGLSSDVEVPLLTPNGGLLFISTGKIIEPNKVVSYRADSSGDDETSSEDDSKVSAGKGSAAGKQKVKIEEPKKDLSSDDNDDSSDDDATLSEDDPKASSGKYSAAEKQKAKIVEPKNDVSSEDGADLSDVDYAMSEDDFEDDKDNKSTSDEDSNSDDDEVTPVQAKSSKKRASVSASKKSVPEKKAKLITPKTGSIFADGKKSIVHVDTPYPSKQAEKTLANKLNQPTPKTEGSHP